MRFSIIKFFREGIKWNVVFLSTVIFTIFFIPVFQEPIQKWFYDLSFTLIFLLGFITSDRKHPAFLPVAISAVVLLWISASLKMPVLFAFSYSLNIIFFGFVIVGMVRHLIDSKTIKIRIILESIIIYLLIGLIFAMVISLINHYDPLAFSFPASDDNSSVGHLDAFMYFTFVTLTTTGFGDMLPKEPYTRSLTIFISITGQMYIAIIVATLVGKYAASRHEDRNEE
ncbi:MAG: potassium channel family protein [Bacteroidetes bacterium]|nr:potassium channel family protein [Bacteroidota bacterium]